MSQKVGRNDPCPCGSTKKYKKCCLDKARRESPQALQQQVVMPSGASPVEPHLPLVRSIIWKGYRWSGLFDQIHQRPEHETFHEFLLHVLRWTFGKDWWEHHRSRPEKRRHPVAHWQSAYAAFTTANIAKASRSAAGAFVSPASGPVWGLLAFAYDLFCLQAKNALPEFLVERLRAARSFQSSRYEVLAAAVMARAGFEISYLDDKVRHEKHCEFIATHRSSGIQVGVEAKSRVRTGVLGVKGEFDYLQDWKGVHRLVSRAKTQKPDGLPFVIFVDVNVPPTPELKPLEKAWVRDVQEFINRQRPLTAEAPATFNALVVSNFAYYYGDESKRASPAEWALIPTEHCSSPIADSTVLWDIFDSVSRYGRISDEV